jgi:hypothetical protein
MASAFRCIVQQVRSVEGDCHRISPLGRARNRQMPFQRPRQSGASPINYVARRKKACAWGEASQLFRASTSLAGAYQAAANHGHWQLPIFPALKDGEPSVTKVLRTRPTAFPPSWTQTRLSSAISNQTSVWFIKNRFVRPVEFACCALFVTSLPGCTRLYSSAKQSTGRPSRRRPCPFAPLRPGRFKQIQKKRRITQPRI